MSYYYHRYPRRGYYYPLRDPLYTYHDARFYRAPWRRAVRRTRRAQRDKAIAEAAAAAAAKQQQDAAPMWVWGGAIALAAVAAVVVLNQRRR